jgi:hypothetical protein
MKKIMVLMTAFTLFFIAGFSKDFKSGSPILVNKQIKSTKEVKDDKKSIKIIDEDKQADFPICINDFRYDSSCGPYLTYKQVCFDGIWAFILRVVAFEILICDM